LVLRSFGLKHYCPDNGTYRRRTACSIWAKNVVGKRRNHMSSGKRLRWWVSRAPCWVCGVSDQQRSVPGTGHSPSAVISSLADVAISQSNAFGGLLVISRHSSSSSSSMVTAGMLSRLSRPPPSLRISTLSIRLFVLHSSHLTLSDLI